MTQERKQQITATMDEVIATSKKIRDYMLSDVPLEKKLLNLKPCITGLEANKNIVSASNVMLNVEKISNDT